MTHLGVWRLQQLPTGLTWTAWNFSQEAFPELCRAGDEGKDLCSPCMEDFRIVSLMVSLIWDCTSLHGGSEKRLCLGNLLDCLGGLVVCSLARSVKSKAIVWL